MGHFVLALLPLLFLTSCGGSASSSSSYPEHSYEEIKDLTITYDLSFSINQEAHFVYFYQETCISCNEIKNEVIDFALSRVMPFYFIVGNQDIPSNYNYQEINQTIGSSDINDVFVGVTPQLVLIKDGKINKNVIKNIYIEEELSHYRN